MHLAVHGKEMNCLNNGRCTERSLKEKNCQDGVVVIKIYKTMSKSFVLKPVVFIFGNVLGVMLPLNVLTGRCRKK
jgi:hypothetical protein